MQLDTLSKYLKANFEKWNDKKVAMRHKDLGVWTEFTWQDYYENVKFFALGLKSMGFSKNAKLSIIGDNEPEWYWSEIAAQAVGGVAVGIFVDCVPDEVKYIVDHSESMFVVAKDQEQIDKILDVQKSLLNVKKVIYWDPKGMWSYDDPFIISWQEVQELGRQYDTSNPGEFESSIMEGTGDDLAIISYTSGTTGLPKGAMITHNNLVTTVKQWFMIEPWKNSDNYLSYVPPAWLTEQVFGITGSLLAGAIVNFPERPETLENDVREIGPSMILYSSRLWESLCSTIQTKIEDGSWIKRVLFKICLPVGYKRADLKMAGKEPGLKVNLLYRLANLLVFRSLRDKIGFKNTRAPYTGGALISPGSFRFFRAIGINLREIYGSSEAGLCCCHREDDVKFETIGQPLPGMEVRLTKEGEILWRGDCIFKGYFKNPEKTREALADGWYHSGDAAHIDEDGHIIYLDRMSDMRELKNGVKYSPQHIEGSLKFSPFIRDVIAIGGGEIPYIVALLQIDFDSVGKWAEKRHIPYTTFADLSQKTEVHDLIEKEVKALNKTLPEKTRVSKFVCLHKELDADEAELTRTRKLRRSFLEEKHRELMRAVSKNKTSYLATSEIKYRDGAVGATTTEVAIRTLS